MASIESVVYMFVKTVSRMCPNNEYGDYICKQLYIGRFAGFTCDSVYLEIYFLYRNSHMNSVCTNNPNRM